MLVENRSYRILAESEMEPQNADQLAERLREVAASRDHFIGQAVDTFHRMIERQYPALRAFEMMSGRSKVLLQTTIEFDFHPKHRNVRVTTRAIPPAIEDSMKVEVRLPA